MNILNVADIVISYEEFKARYREAADNIGSVSGFWNTYNVDPHGMIRNRQYSALRDRLFGLLRACKSIDENNFNKIHKGHPYYFIGICSYFLNDYQTAIYFFDAAVTEDLSAGAHPQNNPKPSTRFLMLEGEENDQGAKVLTQIAQAKVERVLDYYNNEITIIARNTSLTLNDLRRGFLSQALTNQAKPELRTLLTSFITYFIEWDFRNEHFDYGVKQGTSEPFFLHLFRGCLLFESLLKLNPTAPPKNNTLGQILQEPMISSKLNIGHIQGRKFDLGDVYKKLPNYNRSIDESILIAYMARNTLGHNLGWKSNINQTQYCQMYLIIAASCLHVIASLW